MQPRPQERLEGDPHGAVGEADGVVPHGVTVFDGEFPAVAKLDPALLRALRQAATDAARNRVTFSVDSATDLTNINLTNPQVLDLDASMLTLTPQPGDLWCLAANWGPVKTFIVQQLQLR